MSTLVILGILTNQYFDILSWELVTGILSLIVVTIVSISLIIGALGIMNSKLVSVTERTTEIGTRLAIGARKSDILTQFPTEAIVLRLTGRVLFIILEITGNEIVHNVTDF